MTSSSQQQQQQQQQQHDAGVLISGPFSFGTNDPVLYGDGKRNIPPKRPESLTMPFASVMRKVQSLDCVSLQTTVLHHNHHKASKFSSTQVQCCGGQRKLMLRSSSFRLASSSSSSSLLQEEDDDDSTSSSASPLSFSKMFPRSPWTLVSVVVFFFLTLNLAFEMVHARHDHHSSSLQQGSLGSAALSSITETLSPILPFTGGIDLRRELFQHSNEQHYTWYDTAASVVSQVQEAFGMDTTTHHVFGVSRGGTKLMTSHEDTTKYSKTAFNNNNNNSGKQYESPISHSKPFVSMEKIADLNLSDLTTLFQYAMKQHHADFDRQRFLSKVNDKIQYIVAEMDAAVTKSRGGAGFSKYMSTTTSPEEQDATGNVDALYFCAILRLFAEWRIVRQVPQGYKGYAVGMNLGHKDIVQNLAKLETGVHHYLENHHDNKSPTLRELLEFEIEQQVHPKLPRLKEKSAAMGLLWVRRQLHYQTCLFANILQVPSPQLSTSHDAVLQAYTQVYGSYHGWAVQKIFHYSFQAAPDVTVIYKYMNPSLLRQVTETSKRIVVSSTDDEENVQDESGATESSTQDDDSVTTDANNKNPLERLIHHVGGELDKFGKHIAGEVDKIARHVSGEWDKLVDNVIRVFDQDVSSRPDATRVRGGSDSIVDARERFVSQQMKQDAHERISTYLTIVEPLLDDLAGLFDDLNMDDPSKV